MERNFLLWVPSGSELDDVDLFMTGFWMSDKPLVQQALAGELAELLLTITTTSSSLAFLRAFWETTVREWNGIDRLRSVGIYYIVGRTEQFSNSRIDKYYMLVRKFVNAAFRLLMRAEWDKPVCEEHNDILTRQGGPLW
jgi:ribosomal RNA-processing protein 1